MKTPTPVALLITMLILAGQGGHAQVTSLSESAEILIVQSPYPDTVYAGLASMTAVSGANVYAGFSYGPYEAFESMVYPPLFLVPFNGELAGVGGGV